MLLSWSDMETLVRNLNNGCFFGPPGTGKSHTAMNTPTPHGERIIAITLTEETPAAELRGHFVPVGAGKFEWMDGPGLVWWREGGRLVLNEVDKAGPDLQSLLLSILDDPNVACLTLPTGETVRPDTTKWRQVIATMNGVPEDLIPPLRERLYPHILVDEPHEDAFNVLPETLRAAARKSVTGGITLDDARRKLTLREWHAFATLVGRGVPESLAANAVWAQQGVSVLTALKITAK